MKRLVSLDLASQETYLDTISAIRTLFVREQWGGDDARTRVREFFESSIYRDGTGSASLFFSGRAGLKAVLDLLDLPQGSQVAIQAFTCTAVVNPILANGLEPLYIDIGRGDLSMDLDDLIRKYSPSVKVLVLQFSFGMVPSHRDEIIQFCAEHDIFLIEDLAHGFLPSSLPQPPQSVRSCALVSFGRSKLISSVFGAGVFTADPVLQDALAKRVQDLPDAPKNLIIRCLLYKILCPLIKDTYYLGHFGRILHRICITVDLFPREVSPKELQAQYDSGFEYAYPEALAKTLLTQIDTLTDQIAMRGERGVQYAQTLSGASLTSSPLLRYPYLLPEESNRSDILRHLEKLGIALGTWYPQIVGPDRVNLVTLRYHGDCPIAEEVCRRIVNLPLNVDAELAGEVVRSLKVDIYDHYAHHADILP